MKTKLAVRNFFLLGVLLANVGCDRISKGIVRQIMEHHAPIVLLKQHLTITKVENAGAFLSTGSALPEPLKAIALKVLPVMALCFAMAYVLKAKNLSIVTATGICFFIGGGIGNIYDRIVYGSVTDFAHIDFVLFRTGIFNMADVSIVMGVILIALDVLKRRDHLGDLFG
ncbi:MAG TPA: signal peptidase II [Cyclobacteriaceae bacterium]|nr:signal peptidase II [Cyclobacteriaceae bacterium]